MFYLAGALKSYFSSSFSFSFSIYCSCFNYIMPSINLLSINSGKVKNESCENASFCSCTNKKAVAENVYEVNQELGPWEIVFFCVPGSSLRGSPLPISTPATQASPGVGNRPPRKKKIAIPRGARLQVKLNLDFLKG